MSVNTLLVDLGGVLLHLNYSLTKQAFEQLGVHPFDEYFTQHRSNDLFEKLEQGQISEYDFIKELRVRTRLHATDDEIIHAWNAMLLQFEEKNLKWLEQMRSRYQIILLSNTNQIHYDAFMLIYQQQFKASDFNERYFDVACYSHHIQLRKPDVSIFQYVMDKYNINPASTLFIDDTIGNIQTAQHMGFLAHHVKHIEDWTTEIQSII
jgi:putative hydrolase of the HAD superfamily